jgi:hypothetical protein
MGRQYDEKAARQRIAERDLLEKAARELRTRAHADGYAGLRGEWTVDAFAAALEAEALGATDTVRRDLLVAAQRILRGPDGPRDGRPGGPAPLNAGRGV